MKPRYYFFILFLLISFSTQAQFNAVKKSIGQKSAQDRYVSHLESKGYAPEVDKDGDIMFTYNDKRYYITIDQKDPEFFRVARLANLNLKTQANIDLAKQICHDVTKDLKVTKVYWSNGQLWASSEQILPAPEDFEKILDRTLKLTEGAYQRFVKDWKNKD